MPLQLQALTLGRNLLQPAPQREPLRTVLYLQEHLQAVYGGCCCPADRACQPCRHQHVAAQHTMFLVERVSGATGPSCRRFCAGACLRPSALQAAAGLHCPNPGGGNVWRRSACAGGLGSPSPASPAYSGHA